MKVVWTDSALQDREDIWHYILMKNPQAAVKLDKLFSHTAQRLAKYPLLGEKGKVLGTRELIPHESYRLIYEVGTDTVFILALVHAARRWTKVEK